MERIKKLSKKVGEIKKKVSKKIKIMRMPKAKKQEIIQSAESMIRNIDRMYDNVSVDEKIELGTMYNNSIDAINTFDSKKAKQYTKKSTRRSQLGQQITQT